MAFTVYAANKTDGSSKGSDVDFNALNKYVVETCDLQERTTVAGVVSGIVDLGTQNLDDAEYVFEGTEEDEAEEIEKNPEVYFKDGFDPETRKPARLKCVPQKPQQCVAIAVDFPDIMLNKGQFFGEENAEEKPLRLWMGGQFYLPSQKTMIIGRPTPLKVTNLDKTRKTKKWSFAKNHLFYKMAIAAKLIKNDEPFLPESIDKLLGKAFQFEVQVYFKESKGKEYYTEYIKFIGALSRGMQVPELDNEPFVVQFNEDNSKESLKEIRSHVVNTIKRASNYEGSKIQKQLEERYSKSDSSDADEDNTPAPEPAPKKEAKKEKPKAKPLFVDEDLDNDLPF